MPRAFKLTKEQIEATEHLSTRTAGKVLGVSGACVGRCRHALAEGRLDAGNSGGGKAEPEGDTPKAGPEGEPAYTYRETRDGATIVTRTDERVTSLEDLIRVCQIDTTRWEVDSWECSAWETPLRGKSKGTAIQVTNFRVKAKLKPVADKGLRDGIEAFFAQSEWRHAAREQYERHAPAVHVRTGERHLLDVGLYDVHFGKLAWGKECGEDYDLDIAVRTYRNAVVDLLDMNAHLRVDKIMLPVGHDFLHVDNIQNQTTSGTQVDADSRYQKILKTGLEAVSWAVDKLADVAPVEILHVPGNHDHAASYALALAIDAEFRNDRTVIVDTSPAPHKARRFGSCLLGYTHGQKLKPADMVRWLSTEHASDWGQTTCREIKTGHLHMASGTSFKGDYDDVGGVIVRRLASLAPADAFHVARMYTSSRRAAEAFVYGESAGFKIHCVANARA